MGRVCSSFLLPLRFVLDLLRSFGFLRVNIILAERDPHLLLLVSIGNGCRAGNPWTDLQYFLFFPCVMIYIAGVLRARANNAHVSFQYIYKLRQFIQFIFPQEFSNPRNPCIIIRSGRPTHIIGIDRHPIKRYRTPCFWKTSTNLISLSHKPNFFA